MRGGAFLNGKEGRVGFRKKSPKYFLEKILLVFERTIKVLQYLMFRILLGKISMFRRNAPINAKRFIQDRDTSICLWVIEDIIIMSFNSVYKLPSCEPGSKNWFAPRLSRIMLHESEIPEIHSEVTMNLTFIYLTSHSIIILSEVSSSHDFKIGRAHV